MRRRLSTLLAILGGVALLAGLPALYVRTQVLDRATFQSRAVAALQAEPVRDLVAERITDQIVDAGAAEVLTYEPIVTSALSSFAGTPEFAGALRVATGNAHDLLIAGRSGLVVDLSRTLAALREQIRSVSPRVASRIPDDLTPTLLELRERAPALRVLRAVDDWTAISAVLLGTAALLLGGAVALAPRRRHQLATVGTSMAAAGALLVVALAIARKATVDHAAHAAGATDQTRAAIASAFDAFFGDVRGWAIGLLVLGVVVALVPSVGDALDPRRGAAPLRTVLHRLFVPPETRLGRGAWGAAVALVGGFVVIDPLGAAQTVATVIGVGLLVAGLSVGIAALEAPPPAGAAPEPRTRLGLPRAALLAAGAGCVAAASVIAAVVVTTVERPEPAKAVVPPEGCNGDRRLCALRLDQVMFPGTHNSFSAAEEPGWLFANQRYGIERQLRDGIRLFLLDIHLGVRQGGRVRTDLQAEGVDRNRVAKALGPDAVAAAERLIGRLGQGELRGERDLFLCHTLCELGAEDLDETLRLFADHLARDRGSVIVWLIEPYMPVARLERALRDAGLYDRLAVLDRDKPLPTLGELVERDRRIVAFTESGGAERPWYMPAWSFIQDTPLGARKVDELRCSRARGGDDSPLLAVHGWIDAFPPPPAENAKAGGAFLRERLARCERLRRLHPNLVAVDFYDRSGVVEIARERNEEAIRAAERLAQETGAIAEVRELDEDGRPPAGTVTTTG